jgi:hypothetical protein
VVSLRQSISPKKSKRAFDGPRGFDGTIVTPSRKSGGLRLTADIAPFDRRLQEYMKGKNALVTGSIDRT